MVQVRHFLVQASAEIDGCFTNRFLADLDPEVQMVARSLALETPEHVAAKMRREGAVLSSLGWFMERTGTAYLVAASFADDEAEQLQDFGHGDVGAQLAKVDAHN